VCSPSLWKASYLHLLRRGRPRTCGSLREASPNMADAVPLDDIERFLCGAGFSVNEILWADRRLSSRPVTTRVFKLLRLHLFRQGEMREMPADQWARFVSARAVVRARRQACLDHLRNVRVAICGIECFKERPALVASVLKFLTPRGVARKTSSKCMCLAPGCGVRTDGVEDFLQHLEESHA